MKYRITASHTRMMKIRFALFSVWLMASIFLWSAQTDTPTSYPVVQAFTRKFDVPDVSKADLVVFIPSQKNSPLYKLQCHSAGFTGDTDFDYSGDFECRLSSIGQKDKFSTLLTEDAHQSRDWESRGRFFESELQGTCAQIPEFGASRHFRLRGMTLTLQISDPVFAESGSLKSLWLTVAVYPDKTARRPIAEVVPLPKARVPADCKLKEHFVDLGE